MLNLKALRQRHADLRKEAGAIFETAEKEGNRDLSAEELEKVKAINSRIGLIREQLDLAEAHNEAERAMTPVTDINDPTMEETARVIATDGKRWKSLGEQLIGVWKAGANQPLSERERTLLFGSTPSGASEAVSSDGGFLVAKQIQGPILERMYNTGELLQRVDNLPIGADFNGAKIPAIDETSRVDGARYGGVLGYWLNEADAKTSSKPKFRMMELALKKLAALFYATDEILQDTTLLEALIMRVMPKELTFRVEDAIFEGTGGGQPLGIMNSPAKIAVAKENGQTIANPIMFENIINMWAQMWAPSQQRAVWLYNSDLMRNLPKMNLAVGVGGVPVWMPAGGISGSPYMSLMGRPLIPVEYCNAVGTEGDIMLADLGEYQTIDKGGIQQASSIHVRFINDETTFRFVYRVDGQPKWNKPLTPFKGSLQKSPFITLASRP